MAGARRARWMLGIVAAGLFLSGVTVWPAVVELKMVVRVLWGDSPVTGELHRFLSQVIEGLEATEAKYPFLLYTGDWLAFAHVMLAILFAGAMRDPVRNQWVIQCGLIMCLGVPVLAGVCVPLRGIPGWWFLIDAAFAPGAALPLWVAYRDVRRMEGG